MSATPFGEHLRREREMRGVSLEEIQVATRISIRFLEALENERWEQLPGGAFNRGFIRSIARFLGIDEDDLVAEYAYGHEGPDRASAVVASEKIPRDYRPAILATVLAVLLIAGGVWTLRHYGSRIISGIHNGFAASANSSASGPLILPSEAATSVSRTTNSSPSPNSPSSVNAPPLTPPSSSSVDPPPAATDGAGLSLTITATKRAELMVTVDGKPAFTGKLRPNNSKQFAAHDTVEIISRRPSALSLSLNGRAISWIGIPNNSRKMRLTRSDLLPAAAEPSH